MAKNKSPTSRGRGRGESPSSQRRLRAAELQVKALEYRKLGCTNAQIAEKLGLRSAQHACYCVQAALRRTLQQPADEMRTIELLRLDALFAASYPDACRGDDQASRACLAIMDRRARLLGLYAPVQVDSKVDASIDAKEGVLVVGATMSPDQWAATAKAHQQQWADQAAHA